MGEIKFGANFVPSNVINWAKSIESNPFTETTRRVLGETDPGMIMVEPLDEEDLQPLYVGNSYNHLSRVLRYMEASYADRVAIMSAILERMHCATGYAGKSFSYLFISEPRFDGYGYSRPNPGDPFRRRIMGGVYLPDRPVTGEQEEVMAHEFAHIIPAFRKTVIEGDHDCECYTEQTKDDDMVIRKYIQGWLDTHQQALVGRIMDEFSFPRLSGTAYHGCESELYPDTNHMSCAEGFVQSCFWKFDNEEDCELQTRLADFAVKEARHIMADEKPLVECSGLIFRIETDRGMLLIYGAHDSVSTQCNVIPVIGYPGNGYESVLRALATYGYATECRDNMGYRLYSEMNNHWSYKPDFILAKARQYSEERPWTTFWSFGGDNVLDLLSMNWPAVVVIDPVPSSVWKVRVSQWRMKNAPELGEVTEAETKRYESEVSRWRRVIEASGSNVVRVSGNLEPDGIAAAMISLLRPVVPLVMAPKFKDKNIIVCGPTCGKTYAAQRLNMFDIQNSKYACECSFALWDRPYEAAHAAHMVAMRRKGFNAILVPLLCAPFFPDAPVVYRPEDQLIEIAKRRGDTQIQVDAELVYQRTDLNNIHRDHKGRLISLKDNEYLSDVWRSALKVTSVPGKDELSCGHDDALISNWAEYATDAWFTILVPYFGKFEGAWRNSKNGSARMVFSLDKDRYVVFKTFSTNTMTIKFWKGSLDITRSFWHTTEEFNPTDGYIKDVFGTMAKYFNMQPDAAAKLADLAMRAITLHRVNVDPSLDAGASKNSQKL